MGANTQTADVITQTSDANTQTTYVVQKPTYALRNETQTFFLFFIMLVRLVVRGLELLRLQP